MTIFANPTPLDAQGWSLVSTIYGTNTEQNNWQGFGTVALFQPQLMVSTERFDPSFIVDNNPPRISSVSISPSSPVPSDTLICSYEGFEDLDGDSDYSTFRWLIDGTEVGTTNTLVGVFETGDLVYCDVIPHDATDAGKPITTSVTIRESEP